MSMASIMPIAYPHTPITGKAAVKPVPSLVVAGTVHSRQEPMKSAMARSDRIAYPVRRLKQAPYLRIPNQYAPWSDPDICFDLLFSDLSYIHKRKEHSECRYILHLLSDLLQHMSNIVWMTRIWFFATHVAIIKNPLRKEGSYQKFCFIQTIFLLSSPILSFLLHRHIRSPCHQCLL